MPDYTAFGRVIRSELALPELLLASGDEIDLPPLPRIDVRLARATTRPAVSWVRHFKTPTRHRWLSVGRSGDEHVLRFPEIADFLVSADGTRVHVDANAAATAPTIRHLLLDHVLPRCLVRGGETVLHASAVVVGDQAVAFMGPTGAGKSTVAVALSQAGASLMADDCLVVRTGEAVSAFGSYPGVRLWPDAIEALGVPGPQTEVTASSEKRRLTVDSRVRASVSTGVPLREICLLSTDDGSETSDLTTPRLERLSGRDTFLALLTHSFRLETGEKADLVADAERVGRLASATSVSKLHLPTEFDALSAAAGGLLEQLSRPLISQTGGGSEAS